MARREYVVKYKKYLSDKWINFTKDEIFITEEKMALFIGSLLKDQDDYLLKPSKITKDVYCIVQEGIEYPVISDIEVCTIIPLNKFDTTNFVKASYNKCKASIRKQIETLKEEIKDLEKDLIE